MKKFLKNILERVLFVSARRVLEVSNPEIVGITGSVGKTSTKEAIFTVLSAKYSVWKNVKNYNNEIGLPLTILGLESGGSSYWSWCKIIFQALFRALFGIANYPQILVLEMGADHPGDMKYLTKLASCKVGVVTTVAAVHLEHFKTLEKIAREKSELVRALPATGTAILNFDNPYTKAMKDGLKTRTITYGFDLAADLRASEVNLSFKTNKAQESQLVGLSFKVNYAGSTVPIFLPNVLGEHFVYAALPAIAVGLAYGFNFVEIGAALKLWQSPKGRMNLIKGIKYSLLIDDTYNASPESSVAAIKALAKVPVLAGKKRLAIFGDLLELGDYTEEGHWQVAQAIIDYKIDEIITCGDLGKLISDQCLKLGMNKDHVAHFAVNSAAASYAQKRIRQGDIILVKGSQGARMERVIKELMAEPEKAGELLVRQGGEWK